MTLIRTAVLAVAGALTAALSGCALQFIQEATPEAKSDDAGVVVEGRVNYIIDGVNKAPYGSFTPAWPAPRMTAIRLQTGEPFASPLVADADGSFRWRMQPGAYVVTRIGFGNYTSDTYLAWPGVLLCVPALREGTLYLGHLRLNGTRNEEEVDASGKVYRYSIVRYRPDVQDERPAAGPAAPVHKRLMRVTREFPAGDRLQERFLADRDALVRAACPV